VWGMGALVILLFAVGTESAHSTPAYRLGQYEAGGERIGSQTAYLALEAASWRGLGDGGVLARKALVVRMVDATTKMLTRGFGECGATVVLVPPGAAPWAEEEWTRERRVATPVYFVEEDETWERVARELDTRSADPLEALWPLHNSYRVEVIAPAVAPVVGFPVPVVQAWLPGVSGGAEVPTIALIAHLDANAAAPGLARGVREGGSGLVALLEALRVFSDLYREPASRGRYNLLFLATSAGADNAAGAKNWLATADSRLTANIEYALCLDELGGSDLYLHSTRRAKNEQIARLYSSFNDTAEDLSVPLHWPVRKINIQDAHVYWEHEQFSRKGVPAGTLSSRPTATPLSQQGSLTDRLSNFNRVAFEANTQVLLRALLQRVYDTADSHAGLFPSNSLLDSDLQDRWLSLLDAHPRHYAFLTLEDPVLTAVRTVFESYSDDVNVLYHQVSDKEMSKVFYQPTESAISVFLVKPVTFDVLFLVVTCIYLLVLYIITAGWEESKRSLSRVFQSKKR